MLIDSIINSTKLFFPDNNGEIFPLGNAAVFRIFETIEDYFQTGVPPQYLATPLPYNNLAIHYNDIVLWCVQSIEDKEHYKISTMTIADTSLWNEFYSFLIASRSNEIKGWKIYSFNYESNIYENRGRDSYFAKIGVHWVPLIIVNQFLCLLSCKNIKVERVDPDEAIQKKRIKKRKLPLMSYHVLKLQVPTRRYGRGSPKGIWNNRIHFCRGHMREYTAEAPLFGRLIGRFWVPPHVRGRNKKGIVMKHYEMGQEHEE